MEVFLKFQGALGTGNRRGAAGGRGLLRQQGVDGLVVLVGEIMAGLAYLGQPPAQLLRKLRQLFRSEQHQGQD
jgi:hypothetical protein